MFKAYLNYWKQYVDFGGRSTRPDYWWVFLINTIFTIIFQVALVVVLIRFAIALGNDNHRMASAWLKFGGIYYSSIRESSPFHAQLLAVSDFVFHYSKGVLTLFWLGMIWKLANLLPRYALLVRRLRDSGLHWSWFFARLVPGLLVLLASILTFEPVFISHSMRILDSSLIFFGISYVLLLFAKLFVFIIFLRASKNPSQPFFN